MKFFCRFKIDELIPEHGHKVLSLLPYHCYFNSIEMVWSQVKRYYNSNISKNGFGLEAGTDMWEGSLFCLFIGYKAKTAVSHNAPSIAPF
jgi:hypothetical protein